MKNQKEDMTIKLTYCEKATTFEKISHSLWRFLTKRQNKWKIHEIFVAFSENLNFKEKYW